jgi:UDP-N-acetylmuramoylalanine--D-glutamate ligase
MFATQRVEEAMGATQHSGRTLIVGLGATGLSAAKYLAGRGEDVCVIDSRDEPPGLIALRAAYPDVTVGIATLEPRWLDGVDRVLWSPGLSADLPLAAEARRRGIPVVSDIELFARAAAAPIAAVTGSNGKSTVVTLARQLLDAMNLRAAAGGNLGPPALDLLAERPDVYVLEVSSFQMESTESLRPKVAALLNISADHLDRHGSLAEYAALKQKLLDAAHVAVFNEDDALVRTMGLAHPRGVPVSTLHAPAAGYGVIDDGGARVLARHGEALLPVSKLRIRGRHNETNALAALALAETIAERPLEDLTALETFSGLPHRCEWIAELRGVTFVNDSKGTNVGATCAAVDGLPGRLVLIAGGQAKGASFTPLVRSAAGKLDGAVLIGEAAGELEQALSSLCPTRRAASMAEAVTLAVELASTGTTVLLSPACASLDMFVNYADRGEQFAAAVRRLKP